MSRIPLPTSLPHPAIHTPSRPESPMSYTSPSPRPTANKPRPESVYSVSNLSASNANTTTSLTESNLAETRKRQGRKDEAIRKKIESELSRKRPASKRTQQRSGPGGNAPRPKQGTVSALRPLPALTVPHSISVADASQLCAAKRTDCVLVVDEEEHLCGIFTAKDLAFRVVGDGLDPRTTPVSAIMTPNPMVTRDSTSATEALQTMVTRGFRHLPVCNEDGDVVGLLDITKVFHESLEKLEKAHGSSQKLYNALEGAQEQFGGEGAANPLMAYVQALRDKMSFPDLGSILDARTAPATVGVKTTVREAARLMRERRTTAVCVMENDGKKIAGIFTSKDVVLRVIAAGLDSKTCSVVRVMTPHPDVGSPSLSIQDALRKMHDGHYLNLPVVDDSGSLVGIVDVLKLTYATLEQVNSIGAEGGAADAAGGPLWGRFFNAVAGDEADTESVVSGQDASEMRPPQTPVSRRQLVDSNFDTPGSEVFPNDSASAIYEDERLDATSELGVRRPGLPASSIGTGPPLPPVDDGTYLFKFVAPSGTTHRFQARYDSYEFITEIVSGKLAADPFFLQQEIPAPTPAAGEDEAPGPKIVVPSHTDFQLLYFDDDGDLVLMTADRDVTDAVSVAKKQGKDRVVVHLRGGKGWDDAVERQGSLKKKSVTIVEEKDKEDLDDSVAAGKAPSAAHHRAKGDDALVFGFLSKDQLLPASVALLAVVIVGVFAASRAQK